MRRNALRTAIVLCAFLAASALAFGQAGRGVGRLGGVVLDVDGKPVPKAKVTMSFRQGNVKFDGEANAKGEFSFIGLGSGMWDLSAVAPGYDPVTETVNVSQLNVNPKVTIRMKKAAKGGGGFIEDESTFEILERGNQLYKDGKYDEAIAAFEEFKAKNPKAYQIDLNIADCQREKGDAEKAIALYNSVLTAASADPAGGKEISAKALAGIGNTYLKQNKLQEAQEYFRKSVDTAPNDELLAYNVGEICFSNQSMDEAQKYFALASKIKPDWADPYLRLGYVYLNKGDNAQAVASFEKFLTLEPEGERAALARNILGAIKK